MSLCHCRFVSVCYTSTTVASRSLQKSVYIQFIVSEEKMWKNQDLILSLLWSHAQHLFLSSQNQQHTSIAFVFLCEVVKHSAEALHTSY
ncbi:hypothetical protein LOK49_LG10G00801 [Camellia lanceoleosa]|uniref:Uncharacterized protein n=1 Tax=Camellia lanceoleosa TaxID=1840588 RepID=A0ACC0G7E4_9ERIC|nr:hypothetical protein LOK49_LG10G00801 [Camellia lanceoleosa]